MPDFDTTEHELQTLIGDAQAAHPSVELLRASGQDVLPPEIEARVAAHLGHCALCTMLLKDLATLPEASLSPAQKDRIHAALPLTPPGTTPLRKTRFLPIAGAVAALLLLSAGVFHLRRPNAPAQGPAPLVASSVTPTPPRPAPAALIPTPLAMPNDAAFALQTRGGKAAGPSVETLRPAFTAYRQGQYDLAAKRFAPLAAKYPSNSVIALYLGVSLLLIHQDQAAFATLSTAHKLEPRSDAARWYSAVAAQHLRAPDAKPLLDALCRDTTSSYSAESCRAAATLP